MLEKRALGKDGALVTTQGLGCMGLSMFYSSANEMTEEEKIAFLKSALAEGITLYNTANLYVGPPHNEELIGKAFSGADREKVYISTKFGIELPTFAMNLKGSAVRGHCEAALARLGTSYVDMFTLCRMDAATPVEETMGALKALVAEGKVRHVGLSEATSEHIRRAHAVHPVHAVEMEWSLWTRSVEADIVPTCRELGIAIMAYSPLGRGFLTGRIRSAADIAEGDYRGSSPRFMGENLDKNLQIVAALEEKAKSKGCTAGQLALAWVHAQGPDVFPIPGTTKLKNLKENIAAASIALTPEEVAELSAIAPPEAVAGARYNEHAIHMCHEALSSSATSASASAATTAH